MHGKAIALFALCFMGTGCALIRDGASLARYEVRTKIDDRRERIRNSEWADEAWERAVASGEACRCSEDYEDGFKDGFSNYLMRGGKGDPPPLPPRRYRAVEYQTPAGYAQVEKWFAGYRHGAEVARDSGDRRWITGPSSTALPVSTVEIDTSAKQTSALPPPEPAFNSHVLLPRNDVARPAPTPAVTQQIPARTDSPVMQVAATMPANQPPMQPVVVPQLLPQNTSVLRIYIDEFGRPVQYAVVLKDPASEGR
ncbi:MAG: hypothetical protein ACJ8C4_17990 [Gemmataceae bacterium]